MSKTKRLNLPLINSGQAQKEITHNEALSLLDALVSPVVQEVGVNAPPLNTQDGELYIIGGQPEGKFTKHAGKIAAKLGSSWRFIEPIKWQEVTLDSDGSKQRFDGKEWAPLNTTTSAAVQPSSAANNILINKDTGEYLKVEHLEEDVALQGNYTDTQIKILHHSIVIAVSIRVLEAISGASSFSVGVEGAATRYGSNLGTSKDTTNLGLTDHPLTYWHDTPIRLTANNGAFTGGKMRVTIQLLRPHGPWNWD